MNGRQVIATLSVFAFGFMVACSGPKTMPPDYVSDLWSNQVRQFSITPVFPPRADLQVGDIYMSCEHKVARTEAGGEVNSRTDRDHGAMWLASMPGVATPTDASGKPGGPGLLSKQYETRVQMQVIPASSTVPTKPPAGGLFAVVPPARMMPVSGADADVVAERAQSHIASGESLTQPLSIAADNVTSEGTTGLHAKVAMVNQNGKEQDPSPTTGTGHAKVHMVGQGGQG
jgi:hypothetical protein